jgi:hypothetical protein
MDNSTNFGTMIFRALEEIWDEQAEFKKAHALVDSREWWVIPNVSPYAESLVQRISTDVFNDQASPDTEASMLLPWMAGIVGIFYVRKTRLPRPALLKLMQTLMDNGKEIPASIVDQMEKTDILVPLHTQDEIQMVMPALMRWDLWMHGDVTKGMTACHVCQTPVRLVDAWMMSLDDEERAVGLCKECATSKTAD